MADLVGKTLGVYTLENSLGRGGMATVYRAYQATIKRYVAIKVMSADIANDPGFVERFSREAEVIASLQHPHILPVIDYGESDGIHYLVMRYLDGGSLEDRMRKKPLSLSEANRFIDQIASALDYAHKRGVIHRDFKASNVLLDDDNNTYLTDFGIARLAGNTSKLTATGTVMGTPAYMSPEQAMGRSVDGRSDIYSLGVVVYEMMTRRLPFVADTPAALVFQHVYEQPAPPRRLNPALPEALEVVILRTLEKDPDDRFQTASDMSRAFSEAAQSAIVAADTADMEGTIVGGPMTPLMTPPPGHGTPAKPPAPRQSTIAEPIAQLNTTSSNNNPKRITGPVNDNLVPGLGYSPTGSTGAAAPARRRLPITLIVAVVVVLILLIAGGFALTTISGQSNDNSTKTVESAAFANATGTSLGKTQIAMIVLSATATKTLTDTETPTLIASATATLTSTASSTATEILTKTPLPTDTPNATMTNVAQQINTVAAFQAQQTATQQQSVINTTAQAGVVLTTQAINQTSTAKAPPTDVPTDIPTEGMVSATDTPVAGNATNSGRKYIGAPSTVMASLQNDGLLAAVTGQLVLQPFDYDLNTTDANSFMWENPQANMAVGDFVMSAQVSWDKANTDDGCGFLFHFNKPDTSTNAFHSAFIDAGGHFRAITHVTKQDDVSIQNNPTPLIDTSTGAMNNLLVIGQGNAFRVFINGKRIASFSPKTRFDGGSLTVGATTGTKSGLICHFSNVWAWQLSGSSAAISGGSVDLVTGLMSTTPGTVISALEQANIIPSNAATQVTQRQLAQLSLSSYKPGQGGQYVQLSGNTIQNLVLSVDLTLDMPESGYCGMYFNGDAANFSFLSAFFLEDNGAYEAYNRSNATWSTKTVSGSAGTSKLFVVDGTTSNRLTLIVFNSQVSVYVNGNLMVSYTDHALDGQSGGSVGFYLGKYKTSVNTDSCIYHNATLWQLP